MKVLLGITASIAAYKALELIRLLRKEGHDVKVVLTKSALNFITSLSCEILSCNSVYVEQFGSDRDIAHLSLAEWADLLVIAPATANIIAKCAGGIGDDLLSTTLLSFQKPILFVPAMDTGMWHNRIVTKNIILLKGFGYHFLEPVIGPLASGKIGKGRFPPIALIYKKILTVAEKKTSLSDKRILITGGRTEEDLDPVRVITNRSTGQLALELLYAGLCRDAEVKVIFGQTSVALPEGMEIVKVRTSEEMLQALKQELSWCDWLIMAAAIGDYRPKFKSSGKIHSERANWEFEKNRDLLREIASGKERRIFVGFSLEDTDTLTRAKEKLNSKHLDYIVLNSTTAIGASQTEAKILKRDGKLTDFGMVSKWELANKILDQCLELTPKEEGVSRPKERW